MHCISHPEGLSKLGMNLIRSPSAPGISYYPLISDLTPGQLWQWKNKTISDGKGVESKKLWSMPEAGNPLEEVDILNPVCQLQVLVHHCFDCLGFQWPCHWFQSGSRLILNMILRMFMNCSKIFRPVAPEMTSHNDFQTRLDIAMSRAVGSTKAELEPFLCSRLDDWSDVELDELCFFLGGGLEQEDSLALVKRHNSYASFKVSTV